MTFGMEARELFTVSEYVIAVVKRERRELFAVGGTLDEEKEKGEGEHCAGCRGCALRLTG